MKKKNKPNRIVSVRQIWTDEKIQKAIELYFINRQKEKLLRMEA